MEKAWHNSYREENDEVEYNSQLLRWVVPERSKLFEDYFANTIQNRRKVASKVSPRLIKKINRLDEEEIPGESEKNTIQLRGLFSRGGQRLPDGEGKAEQARH